MITDEETKVINRLQEILRSRLNIESAVSQTVFFSFGELNFTDRIGLEKALELIKEKTNKAIFASVRTGTVTFRATTTASIVYEGMPIPQEIGIEIKVADPSQLSNYFNLVFLLPPKENLNLKKQSRTFIEHREDGNFYSKGKLINFPNPNAIYAKFFKVVFKLSALSESISYEQINKGLEAQGLKKLTDSTKIMNRLKNARNNLYNHVNLPEETPKGDPLMKPVRGKALIFKNPKL